MGRAREAGLLEVHVHQIRDFATDKHKTVDDIPYGGGAGMVMKCEPLYKAWLAAKERNPNIPATTIYLSPQGIPLTQGKLQELHQETQTKRLILICGRYEGIDERFIEQCVDHEISIGDYVLSGGELPALVLIDGLMRLIPGALGNASSVQAESFSTPSGADKGGILEHAHYTRPPEFMGRKVPEVLLSGDQAKISAWRKGDALERTRRKRPDLLKNHKEQ